MEQQEPIVLPPESKDAANLRRTKKQLDDFAFLMDRCFRVPGIGWRFGLEALIGLIPGAGDVVTGTLGLVLLVRAFQFRLPKVVILRMIMNTVLDVTVGAIPFIGDAFDFFWKSNTRNMQLFHEYASAPAKSTRPHWLFLGGLIVGFMFLMFCVLLFAVWIILRFYS